MPILTSGVWVSFPLTAKLFLASLSSGSLINRLAGDEVSKEYIVNLCDRPLLTPLEELCLFLEISAGLVAIHFFKLAAHVN